MRQKSLLQPNQFNLEIQRCPKGKRSRLLPLRSGSHARTALAQLHPGLKSTSPAIARHPRAGSHGRCGPYYHSPESRPCRVPAIPSAQAFGPATSLGGLRPIIGYCSRSTTAPLTGRDASLSQ